jgi:hypothetical protein
LSRGGENPSVNTERRGRAEFNGKFVLRRIVSWPRYRKGMDHSIAGRIAREIINHLRLANWPFHWSAAGPPGTVSMATMTFYPRWRRQ